MVGFLPLFMVVLVWMKGMSFFNSRFLGRAALGCLAGLSLYLLLPAIQSVARSPHVPFGLGLKTELTQQKDALSQIYQFF
jgi:hypothetical protein